jgi:hypothetical protein
MDLQIYDSEDQTKMQMIKQYADAFHAQREFHTPFGTERGDSLVSSMDCIKIYGLVSELKLR